MKNAVNQRISRIATPAGDVGQPMSADSVGLAGEAHFGHHAVVPNPCFVNRKTRQVLVLRKAVGQMRKRILHSAQREPGNVIHRVAKMGQLPIDHGGHPRVVIHEVARTGVALHKDRLSVVSGHVVTEPVQANFEKRIDLAVGVGRSPADGGHLNQRVFGGRQDRTELGDVERLWVDEMQGGEITNEVLGHRHLFVGIGDSVEPRFALDSLGQHGLGFGVDGQNAGDGHARAVKRSEDLGLNLKGPEDGNVGRGATVVTKERLLGAGAGFEVDEPGFTVVAPRYPPGSGDRGSRLALDPGDDVARQARGLGWGVDWQGAPWKYGGSRFYC